MGELIEYFTRHYTLVLDNEELTYNACRSMVADVLNENGLTLAEYKALSDDEKASRFADAIGTRILDFMSDEFDAALPDPRSSIGGSLADEIMMFSSSELAYTLGKHYMPEDSDAADILSDDDEADDE